MFAVSCTTRPRRAAESPGKCYDFITEAEFQRKVAQGEFLEYAQVFGRNWYGTPRQTFEEARRTGRDLVLEIDVQGAKQVKEKLPEAIAIFIVPPSRQDLERRLRSRGQDSDEAIARRLQRAGQEMASSNDYDFVVVNDDLERAVATKFAQLLWQRGAGAATTTSGSAKFENPLEVARRMPVFNQAPESQFAYVVVAGKRARQLMSGAMPLVANPRSHKSTRIAMEELNASRSSNTRHSESAADIAPGRLRPKRTAKRRKE